ncbi:MAG: uroporphyrinogen-III C-methyltransferase [Acidobacteria bacterium]|nr:uroporphyrinogen-III C-methyltransferase [Acidobacteriota bacterium]
MTTSGKAFLVGAGPGDPELLTIKAARILRSADVVLHDELVGREILRLIPPSARLINVGKRCGKRSTPQEEINRLLVQNALLGFEVVRLKGGDPFIFGRGGEELEALRRAGIEVEIVPGVTAALGAAASVQVPLTHRDLSSALVLVSGASKHPSRVRSWPDRLPSNATLAIYMPGHELADLQARLLDAGVLPEMPCAIISGATRESERVDITTVSSLGESQNLGAPRLVVIGEVVRLADRERLKQQFREFSITESHAQPGLARRERGK